MVLPLRTVYCHDEPAGGDDETSDLHIDRQTRFAFNQGGSSAELTEVTTPDP
jgi:hypothetical protein